MTKFQLLRNWLIYVIFLITTLVGTTWLNVAYAWEGVVIHHSATSPNTKAESIKRYHVEERGWDDIGYHWIIEADGRIVQGRSESTVGAHALNPKPSRNQTHIGICVIGNDQFSAKQYLALRGLF
jgi:N-acetylmuramoyl-L-alanine amidase